MGNHLIGQLGVVFFLGGAIMIDSFEIFNKANSIVKKLGTRNPFVIADELGIKVYFHEFQDLLGMYRIILRQRSVFLNSNLDHHWR